MVSADETLEQFVAEQLGAARHLEAVLVEAMREPQGAGAKSRNPLAPAVIDPQAVTLITAIRASNPVVFARHRGREPQVLGTGFHRDGDLKGLALVSSLHVAESADEPLV